MSIPAGDITEILNDPERNPKVLIDEVFPILYDQFRKYAARLMRSERQGHTLQPTDLVHQAWVILRDSEKLEINDRQHFFRLAARRMRFILVEYSRHWNAMKRGGGDQRVTLTDQLGLYAKSGSLDVLDLNEALEELDKEHPRIVEVVDLRHIVGLTIEETAVALEISPETVKRDWRFAKAWLVKRLGPT